MATDRRLKNVDENYFSVIEKVEQNLTNEEIYDYVVKYTNVFQENGNEPKEKRELECLKVMYPATFKSVEENQWTIGSLNVLPLGVGCTTTAGGVGFYAQIEKLEQLKNNLEDLQKKAVVQELIDFWKNNDSREKFYKDNLIDNELGRFVEIDFPAIVTARLSGMYLDYNLLCEKGLVGLKEYVQKEKEQNATYASFYDSLVGVLDIFENVLDWHIVQCDRFMDLHPRWKKMKEALQNLKTRKPESFLEALELTWLYSLMSGVNNYGRMDDYLGDYLVKDLESGAISEEEVQKYVCSLFDLMEQRRTLANSRVIIGGRGRKNEASANVFCKYAIRAVQLNKDIEPQLTLRYYKGMSEDIYNQTLDAIGEGTTFPIIYNDDVNIPAIANAMEIDDELAKQYVPLGCGEINISGHGVSTPNTCINMLKVLTIALNEGIDPSDGIWKSGHLSMKKVHEFTSFEDIFAQYTKLLDYYIEMCACAQKKSYEYLNQDCSFLFTSLLIDNCVERGKAVLDGGVHLLGGTNETYGNISTSDALYSLESVVYKTKQFTLEEVVEAIRNDFVGYEHIQKALLEAGSYGNDDKADEMAIKVHEHVCNGMRDQAKKVGMDYYLVVMINNQIGTQWGLRTWASTNGRKAYTYMSNGNNPQSGNDKNGPTAMLNSLCKLSPAIHAGAVQNMKFSKQLFQENRDIIKQLLEAYFEKGAQIMITVVGKEELEDAYYHPEKYPNLIVRVGGFSARFIDLNKTVQREVMDRTLN